MKTKHSVFLTFFIAVALYLIQSGTLEAQPKKNEFFAMDYNKSMAFIAGDESAAPFYISDRPVTNKEYILYLMWTNMVFGGSYPETLFEVLPGFNASAKPDENYNPFSDSASFRYYLDHSESYVSEYIFNPYYLNSAVIGISWEQANNYCRWLSDRYNEYSLITKKFLILDFNQQDESNFTTESYILRQYEGLVRNDPVFFTKKAGNGFKSLDYLLRPSFHLATRYELQTAYKQFSLVDCFCESTKDLEFLKPWFNTILPESKGYIYFDDSNESENFFWLHSDSIKEDIKLPEKISEWCLDSYTEKEEKSIPAVYRNLGYEIVKFLDPMNEANYDFYPQKDRFGKMPFIITGETKEREFEMIKGAINLKDTRKTFTPYIFDHKTGTVVNRNGDVFTCFRAAVNAIRK